MANAAQIKRIEKMMPDSFTVHRVAETFAALADPTRARILFALSKSELCVDEIAALLRMTVSAISHQLRLLRQTGLVKYRKVGRRAYYSLDDEHSSEILTQTLEHIAHAQPQGFFRSAARSGVLSTSPLGKTG